jgi:hypothetical protein
MELTVAEVSGLIAAGVFVLQILIPLAIPWALIAFVSQENSVITWYVSDSYQWVGSDWIGLSSVVSCIHRCGLQSSAPVPQRQLAFLGVFT